MDIHLRKIQFLQEFLKISNERVITQLENLLRGEYKQNPNHEPYTEEEFLADLDASEKDFEQGRWASGEDVLKKYK